MTSPHDPFALSAEVEAIGFTLGGKEGEQIVKAARLMGDLANIVAGMTSRPDLRGVDVASNACYLVRCPPGLPERCRHYHDAAMRRIVSTTGEAQ